MDEVTIRATVSAHGMRKGDHVTVAETPLVAGGLANGVFQLVERHTAAVPVGQNGGTGEGVPSDTDPDGLGQDPLEAMTRPEVAADNSTVVPSHVPGTRPADG